MNPFEQVVGLHKLATIQKYDDATQTAYVTIDAERTALHGKASDSKVLKKINMPMSLWYNNGFFIGTKPQIGSSIIVGQGPANTHYFVSFINKSINSPKLKDDELLITTNTETKISLDIDNNINIGGSKDKLHIYTDSVIGNSLVNLTFDNKYEFTQSSRNINGVVRRERRVDPNFISTNLLKNDSYNNQLSVIGLDPTVSTNISDNSKKNPPFVESRTIIYEFAFDANVNSDLKEADIYSKSQKTDQKYTLPNRRSRRTDTLSLGLDAPNYLIEKTEGTVVDIFGNILDLNRQVLPIGSNFNLSLKQDQQGTLSSSFLKIKSFERRSLAYHFEINARKDLSGVDGQVVLPDINSNDDYARNRSRFFLDIDKEGQFKMNVPASSERGNIPLLTRYENYSSFGKEDNGNKDKLFFRDDNLDIFHDSFVQTDNKYNLGTKTAEKQVVIKNNDVEITPIDRLTNKHIKYGTAHHDILATCITHQRTDDIKYQPIGFKSIDIDSIPLLKSIVSPVINVGDKANAGGRSGSINFDGSLDLNMGANTADRQSLVMDCAGGIVSNIGRDKQNISAAITLDGQMLMQIGGQGISKDSRFSDLDNGFVGGVLDIRVLNNGGQATLIRIDDSGISIMTPQRLNIHANQDIKIRSDGAIQLDAKTIFLHNRLVKKQGLSI